MRSKDYHFYVYILASRSRHLYVGVTNNLNARIAQHREQTPGTYTARYKITRLVHFEDFSTSTMPSPAKRNSRSGTGQER